MIKIAPSILSADFSKMGELVAGCETGGADVIHCDVMDGNFVPTITFGAKMVKDIGKHTKLPLDVHLMVREPVKHIGAFSDAGADIITFHLEAEGDPYETLQKIKSRDIKCGVVINPYTPVESVFPFIPLCDMILLMSVVAGKGGQAFIPEALGRISKLRSEIEKSGKPVDIEIDGGITEDNIAGIVSAGANVIVAGSAIFASGDIGGAIERLRRRIKM